MDPTAPAAPNLVPRPVLQAAIPLVAAAGIPIDEGRVLLSAGIAPADGEVVRGRAYRSPAYVPRLPWRRPTDDEFRALMPARPHIVGVAFVAIVRVSPSSLRGMHSLGFGADLDEAAYRALCRSEAACEGVKACLSELGEYVGDVGGLRALGFAIGEPGIPTVATDPVLRAGLHVDDWDEADERARSRNRLHLNLGHEPRHLLYIPVPVDQLVEDHHPAGAMGPGAVRGTRVANAFMRQNPHAPVVRVRIDPGEAYIAATDYIVHDGDSTGKRLPDVNYALLGRFVPPPSPPTST